MDNKNKQGSSSEGQQQQEKQKQPKSRSRSNSKQKKEKIQNNQVVEDSEEELQKEILKNFGFTSFGSSKGKDHSASAAQGFFKAKNEKRNYRQYMHRRGGFNRLLDQMD